MRWHFIKLSVVTLTLDLAFVLIQCTLRNRIKECLTSPPFQCVAHVCIPTTGSLNVFSAPSWKCVQKHLATCVESWHLHTNRSPQIVSRPRWCICRVLVSEHGAAATCAGYQARSSTQRELQMCVGMCETWLPEFGSRNETYWSRVYSALIS